jgi:hypothetical protein
MLETQKVPIKGKQSCSVVGYQSGIIEPGISQTVEHPPEANPDIQIQRHVGVLGTQHFGQRFRLKKLSAIRFPTRQDPWS